MDSFRAINTPLRYKNGTLVILLVRASSVKKKRAKNIFFARLKTALQEAVQAVSHDRRIVYEVINSTGPEHLRNYEVKVLIGGEEFGRGIGNSKKEAEMKAAAEALNKLG